MNRPLLANQIAAGLAGWHQLQVVQKLGDLAGEDTARSLLAQIINAQGRFKPATSQLPENWGVTKRRIDIALLGRSEDPKSWYGAIEIKWPGSSFDPHLVRESVVQDVARLAFINTSNLNAKFLIIGGNTDAMELLFDSPHNATDREERRLGFNELLSRDLASPSGHLNHSALTAAFPKATKRVPTTVIGQFNGRLKTELLAHELATVDRKEVGEVFVWQCNRTKGTA